MESAAVVETNRWPLETIALRPIRPDKACGDDAAYDDDYLRMKQVVDGLSAAGGAEADFELLVELGEKLLASRSKDLRVATFLAIGLERIRGAAGLAEALAVIDALIGAYWEMLYPPLARLAGRQNALQSLSDRLKDRLAEANYPPSDRPFLEQARERLSSIQQFTLDAMEDRAPALTGLLMSIDEALRKMPTATAAAPEVRQEERQPSPTTAAPSTPAPSSAPQTGTDAFSTPADALRAVERAADFLREKDPQDPVPYLLLRAVLWGPLIQVPPNEDGRTLIPPLPEARREALAAIAAGKEHEQLIRLAEEIFVESPLLLDAQRHLVQGLDRLGEDMSAVREAVLYAVAVLLRRVERLPDLLFNDGTPFADGATRAWIASQVMPLMAASGSGGTQSADTASPIETAYAAALAKLDGGNLQSAFAAMQQGSDLDRGARDRYLRRLHLARLCMTARQFALARPVLEGLAAELERQGLVEWEPGLAIETWRLLYACLGELVRTPAGADGELERVAARVFDRICQVDAAQALDLMPTPSHV